MKPKRNQRIIEIVKEDVKDFFSTKTIGSTAMELPQNATRILLIIIFIIRDS